VVYFFDPAKALTPKETHFVLHAVKAANGDDWETWEMGDEWYVDWVTVGP